MAKLKACQKRLAQDSKMIKDNKRTIWDQAEMIERLKTSGKVDAQHIDSEISRTNGLPKEQDQSAGQERPFHQSSLDSDVAKEINDHWPRVQLFPKSALDSQDEADCQSGRERSKSPALRSSSTATKLVEAFDQRPEWNGSVSCPQSSDCDIEEPENIEVPATPHTALNTFPDKSRVLSTRLKRQWKRPWRLPRGRSQSPCIAIVACVELYADVIVTLFANVMKAKEAGF
ncbi:hypothetical protein BU25DRAFT_425623 [Macroventuria anomochaeta]|uniref:Uncharacterized protein n=1 Tax=Macroventuria anomochaeta TaxID=301207 RepID=A0ACB6RNF2_9PLEO|nr:uncharacterized protein BU25DRAFT_425623 [Macroventuria anomochaeta]KAF2622449.1 hypothetical protein BU25DRAFT_425623 [Macroventuria anomochaeta]